LRVCLHASNTTTLAKVGYVIVMFKAGKFFLSSIKVQSVYTQCLQTVYVYAVHCSHLMLYNLKR